MPDYFVFGGCLRSELPFPELAETSGRKPDWTLRLGKLPPDDGAEVLSDTALSRTCRVRLTRRDTSFRYAHSCTGAFEVSADGSQVAFEPASGGDLNTARTDFVARVLLYCVDRGGVVWLHGSAVRIAGSAVAFLGRSGAGKSTLALALSRAGGEHISDDTLPVEVAPEPMVWPSDHVIRLSADSRRRLASGTKAIRRESDGKFVLTRDALSSDDITPKRRAPGAERTPLAALYLLNPVAIADAPRTAHAHVARRLLSPRMAVPALMQHVKLGPVLRAEDPVQLLQQLGVIACSVPVFELRVTKNWMVVDQVVAQIMGWHAESDREAAPALALSTPFSILA